MQHPRRCAGSQPARGRGRHRRLLPAPRRSRDAVGPPAAPPSREDGDGGSRFPRRGRSNFQELARESADDFFATTLRVWSRLAPPGPALPSWEPGSEPLVRAPVEEAHEVLVTRLGEESGGLHARLEDAFEPERVRYELTLDLVDSTEAVLRRLLRPAWEEIDLGAATFTLTPGTRLLWTCHDWQSWLGTSAPEPPPESDVSFLCHQDGPRPRSGVRARLPGRDRRPGRGSGRDRQAGRGARREGPSPAARAVRGRPCRRPLPGVGCPRPDPPASSRRSRGCPIPRRRRTQSAAAWGAAGRPLSRSVARYATWWYTAARTSTDR